MNKGKKILKVLLVAVIGVLLLGTVLMLLWNWLVPVIFQGPRIDFWQALGLFILARILFGSWGKGAGPGWKHRYYEKFSAMTPEQRERFKRRMTEKWCSGGRSSASNPAPSND